MLQYDLMRITIVLIISNEITSWKCAGDKQNTEPNSIPLPSPRLRRLSSIPFTPLEIYFDYTKLDKQISVVDDQSQINNIKMLLNEAKELFKSILKVKRLTNKLTLGNNLCSPNIEMSSAVKEEGVEADIIVFPFIDVDLTGNTLAYAATCLYYEKYRTVAGFIGFPKLAIESRIDNWKEYYLSLVLHELTHVLVFNKYAFNNFVDKDDQPLQILAKTSKTVNGISRVLVSTPRVISAARKHFNCPTLEGVELENQGGSGTQGSHWEARVMLDDYMIGVRYSEVVMSDITLALFEDSGWYTVNYYTGGLFRFGKNEGCSFVNSKCIQNGETQFTKEFCTEGGKPLCTNSRLAKGVCYITKDESIPKEYQYINTTHGGGLILADYCPVSIVYTNLTRFLNGNCQIGTLEHSQDGEILSDKSICFLSSLTESNQNTQLDNEIAICYPYQCDHTQRIITVKVLKEQIQCPTQGGSVTHSAFKGSLLCPKFIDVCTTEIPCNDIKSCIQNKSVSFLSKEGYDSLVESMLHDDNSNTTTNKGWTLFVNSYIIGIYLIIVALL